MPELIWIQTVCKEYLQVTTRERGRERVRQGRGRERKGGGRENEGGRGRGSEG